MRLHSLAGDATDLRRCDVQYRLFQMILNSGAVLFERAKAREASSKALVRAARSRNFGNHLAKQVPQDRMYSDGGCRLIAVTRRDEALFAHDGGIRQGTGNDAAAT